MSLNTFETPSSEILDRPLQSEVIANSNPTLIFFQDGFIRPGHKYIVQGYSLKFLDLDLSARDWAWALSYAFCRLIPASFDAVCEFHGADLVDFHAHRSLIRPAAPPVVLREHCRFNFRVEFSHAESFSRISGARILCTLHGEHHFMR